MAFNAGDIEARLTLDRRPFQREMDAAIREGRRFDKMEFEATLDANKRPFVKAINEARAAGVRFSQTSYKTKLGVDRTEFAKSLRKAASEVKRISGERGSAKIDLDTSDAINEANKLERHTRYVGIQVANNFRSPLRKIKWPAIFAAITAGAIAVPPALFGVVGALGAVAGAVVEPIQVLTAYEKAQEAVASGSDDAAAQMGEFRQAMQDLTPAGRDFVRQVNAFDDELETFGDTMQRAVLPGLTSMLHGLEDAAPAITDGMKAVGQSIARVTDRAGDLLRNPVFQGQLTEAFENSVPVIESAGDLVVNLMRDMTQFAARTESLGQGLGDMFDEVSAGFTDFFNTLTPYSDTLGRSFAALGGIAGDLLGALGRFSGMISEGTAPALESLRSILQQVYDSGLAILETALPGVTEAALAFGAAVNTALAALGPLAPLIGSVAGTLAPFALGLKAIDLISFGRINQQWANMKTGIGAATTASGKAKTAMRGLASIGFGPLGLAAVAVGGALMLLGQRQQEAAQAAAAHKEQVRALTAAIIEDNGVIGAATRQYQLKKAADEGVIASSQQLGIETNLLTDALLGDKDATTQVTNQLASLRDRQYEAATSAKSFGEDTGEAAFQALGQKQKTDDLIDTIFGYSRAARAAEQAAMRERAALNGVTVEVLKQMNAMQQLYTQQMTMIDASLGLREAQNSLKKAQKETTRALKEHGRASQEYTDAALSEDRAIEQVLNATHRKTKAQHEAEGAEKANARAIEATDRAALKMARTYEGRLPPVLRQYISGMGESRAAAADAKLATDNLGNAVIKLPGGKTIKLKVDAAQAQAAIQALNDSLDSIQTYKETVVAVRYTSTGKPIAGSSGTTRAEGAIDVHPYATGGITWKGKPVKPMESGYAAMVPPNTPRLIGDHSTRVESFIPHDNSVRSVGLLAETNRRMGDPLGVTRVAPAPAPAAPAPVQNIYRFEAGSVTLDASGIRDIQDLLSMFENLRQTARANGARVSTRGRE